MDTFISTETSTTRRKSKNFHSCANGFMKQCVKAGANWLMGRNGQTPHEQAVQCFYVSSTR